MSKKAGDPGEIRTPDLWFRKPLLYPPELRGHRNCKSMQALQAITLFYARPVLLILKAILEAAIRGISAFVTPRPS